MNCFIKLIVWIIITHTLLIYPLKVLHLSFHQGCIKDFEYIGNQLNLELTSLLIGAQPQYWLDEQSTGNCLYNLGHDRAERIWNKHKDFFNDFDVIITSDTAPLARIFLQNNWQKPLIIWICNRFDYYDAASKDCLFPDPEYYQLFQEAYHKNNIRIVGYTAFEHYYVRTRGLNLGDKVIKPCGKPDNCCRASSIPQEIIKQETFFIPPYHNDTIFCNLANICKKHQIPAYNGRYNGAGDLKDFKGIIHIPYAWSNLALFENLQNGIPYFIPSKRFILELQKRGNFFFNMLNQHTIEYSEWYGPDLKDVFVYFDSWHDLVRKIKNTDFVELKEKILQFAKQHHDSTLLKWKDLFDSFNVSK